MKKLRQIVEKTESEPTYGISPDRFKKDLKSKSSMDYEHVHDEAQKHLTGDVSHMGHAEKHAVARWTTPEYRDVNNYLRGESAGDSDTHHLTHTLKEAVGKHSMPNSTWAYRGVHGPQSQRLKKLKAGDTFHNEGFSSTTLDPKRATHFGKGEDIMAIHVHKGAKALYASHPNFNPGHQVERELVLHPSTHMIYHGHEDIQIPEHHYSGRATGKTRTYRLHHVSLAPTPKASIVLDRD